MRIVQGKWKCILYNETVKLFLHGVNVWKQCRLNLISTVQNHLLRKKCEYNISSPTMCEIVVALLCAVNTEHCKQYEKMCCSYET